MVKILGIGTAKGDKMECPKCGDKWLVVDTVTGSKPTKQHLITGPSRVVGWFVEDEYVSRKRRCFNRKCFYEGSTVEVELPALEEMLKISPFHEELEQKGKRKGPQ